MANDPGQYVYQGFIKRGFYPHQAAVLAGNFQQESGFDPAAWNPKEEAAGAMQWRLDRRTGLEQYAQETGRRPDDLDAQMDWVVKEMTGPEAKNAAAFLSAGDLAGGNAAIRKYIRYGDNSEGARLKYAQAFAGSNDNTGGEAMADNKGAVPSKADFLKSWRESAQPIDTGAALPMAADAPGAETGTVPSKTDFLKQWRGESGAPAAVEQPETVAPAAASIPSPDVFTEQTPGAFGVNPMAVPGGDPVAPPAAAGGEPYADSYLAQGMSGVNEGIGNVLGAPVDIATLLINKGIEGTNWLSGANIPTIQDPAFGSGQINRLMGNAGAITPETNDPGKRFVRRVAQEVGATAVPVLGQFGRVAQPLRMAATELGLATGSGTGAAVANQLMPDNPYADMAGQVLGGLTAGGAGKLLAKGITPFGMTAERQAAADALEAQGVNALTAGQKTGSPVLKQLEANVGGNKLLSKLDEQKEQFTAATLKSAGIDAKRATPEVIDQAFNRIGSEFDDLAMRNTLKADQGLVKDLGDVWSEYTAIVNPTARAPIVESTVRDISDAIRANGGTITGEAYQAMRSRLDKAARSARADPQLSDALSGLRGALDGAMERSITPEDLAAWKQARSEYRNMLTIERAAVGAGEDAALGLISPVRLKAAAVAQGGKRGYARGSSDLGNTARNALIAMGDLPPAAKGSTFMGLSPSRILGAVGGAITGGPMGAATGAGLGYLADKALPVVQGNMLMSGPVQKYLANSLMTNNPRMFPMGIGAVPGGIANATGNMVGKRQPVEITIGTRGLPVQ